MVRHSSYLLQTSRLVGGALGLAIATARTNSDLRHMTSGVHGVHVALTSGFDLAFVVAAGFAAAGAVIAVIGLPHVPTRASERAAVATEGA